MTNKEIYEEVVKTLVGYKTGSLHPFVSKNTKRGESFHEPTMQHLHKIINKYDKLAKEAQD
jgi:hypothetical protein|tara:strand:+ start:1573 stop:1755 length:183 start_codon:yes stop_codon:yes gene_type:complete